VIPLLMKPNVLLASARVQPPAQAALIDLSTAGATERAIAHSD